MSKAFDLVVVGSGSAGHTAAITCRERGWSVAIVDERPFGGTCVLRGCDPKKVLVNAARVVDDAQRLVEKGILDRVPALRWSELMRFKRTFTDPMPEQRREIYEKAGIAAMHGRASFANERTLLVNGETLEAKHVVIASGAMAQHVAPGDDLLIDSEGFLDLEELPPSLIFVGGGYIAFEFAHVAARAGAKVTILHRGARPLEGFDEDGVARVAELTRRLGIDLQLGTSVTGVRKESGEIVVSAQRGGATREFRARLGVLAAGRVPNLDGLSLEHGHVARTKRGVEVNEYLQSVSNPAVYAAGDAADAGGLPLTPVAGNEGEIVAENLLEGNRRKVEFRGLTSMVYTIPPLGVTGLSEVAARERGIAFDVHQGDMLDWYSTRAVAGRAAFYKVLIEKSSGRVLGATILGPHAEEQINVLSLAIRAGIDAATLRETFFAYPTGSSDFEYMF